MAKLEIRHKIILMFVCDGAATRTQIMDRWRASLNGALETAKLHTGLNLLERKGHIQRGQARATANSLGAVTVYVPTRKGRKYIRAWRKSVSLFLDRFLAEAKQEEVAL